MVQKKRAQKPAGSKWDLINPTGPLLEVVDVRAETTVEGRDILMMGPVKCDKTSFKVVLNLSLSFIGPLQNHFDPGYFVYGI